MVHCLHSAVLSGFTFRVATLTALMLLHWHCDGSESMTKRLMYKPLNHTILCNSGITRKPAICTNIHAEVVGCNHGLDPVPDCRSAVLQVQLDQHHSPTAAATTLLQDLVRITNDDETVRKITFNVSSVLFSDIDIIGGELDKFLTPRPWWYVVTEPFEWQQQHRALRVAFVLERYHYAFEPYLRLITATQYLDSAVCSKTPLLLGSSMCVHPGLAGVLGMYSIAHDEAPFAVHNIYASDNNSPTDNTAFITGSDCPERLNKWECAFLPMTNCSVPSVVTSCPDSGSGSAEPPELSPADEPIRCVQALLEPHQHRFSAVFSAATQTGELAHKREEEQHVDWDASLTPPPPGSLFALLRSSRLPRTALQESLYNAVKGRKQPKFVHRWPPGSVETHSTREEGEEEKEGAEKGVVGYQLQRGRDISPEEALYLYQFLLRKNRWFRAQVARRVSEVRWETGFRGGTRCVAAQIRRGDRIRPAAAAEASMPNSADSSNNSSSSSSSSVGEGFNVSLYCSRARGSFDLGCDSVPYAAVRLRHVLQAAEQLVSAGVHHLFVATDDEPWLRAEMAAMGILPLQGPGFRRDGFDIDMEGSENNDGNEDHEDNNNDGDDGEGSYVRRKMSDGLGMLGGGEERGGGQHSHTHTYSHSHSPHSQEQQRWKIVFIPAPIPPLDAQQQQSQQQPQQQSQQQSQQQYKFARSEAGTASGVLLHASLEMARQCEAFVGHFDSSMTVMFYNWLCVMHRGAHAVCPPVYDLRYQPDLLRLREQQ